MRFAQKNIGGGFSLERVVNGALYPVLHTHNYNGYVALGGRDAAELLDVRGNIKLLGLLKTVPVYRGSLPAASAGLEGSIATIKDPTAGKSNVVYCNGTQWLYMDGTQV